MSKVVLVEVTENVITVAHHNELVTSPAAGAIASFSGDVRENDKGRSVQALEYEIHPSAQLVLQQIAEEIASKFDVERIAVSHRYGPIPIGEAAMVVSVSAVHRDPAFDACREIVEKVKKNIPIWKHQSFTDGTDEWVNCA